MDASPAVPHVEFEVDDNLEITLVISCATCSHVTRAAFSALSPGNIKCAGCGYEFRITEGDIFAVQEYLDNIKKETQILNSIE